RLRETEGLVGAEAPHFQRLDGKLEVVHRARRTGEVQDAVERSLDVDELGDVVFDEPEPGVAHEVGEVVRCAGDEAVHGDHLVAVGDEPVTEVRAEESGGAGDQYAHVRVRSGKWNVSGGMLPRTRGAFPRGSAGPAASGRRGALVVCAGKKD